MIRLFSERGLSAKELLARVKNELQTEIEQLKQLPSEKLLEERYQRFRKILKRQLELKKGSSFLVSLKNSFHTGLKSKNIL